MLKFRIYIYNANMIGTKGLNLNHPKFIKEISDTLTLIYVFKKNNLSLYLCNKY